MMQMIKNNKGITLISLVITIIVLLILTSTSLIVGYQSLNSTTDNTKLSDIQMVQQAIYERGYIINLNNVDKVKLFQDGADFDAPTPDKNTKPKLYLGEPLYKDATYYINGLEVHGDSSRIGRTAINIKEVIKVFEEASRADECFRLKEKVSTNNAETLYDDLYYVLDKEDLRELGIDNSADIYVANYQTGEIFNWSMKHYNSGELVYLDGKPTDTVEPDGINAVTEDVTSW